VFLHPGSETMVVVHSIILQLCLYAHTDFTGHVNGKKCQHRQLDKVIGS